MLTCLQFDYIFKSIQPFRTSFFIFCVRCKCKRTLACANQAKPKRLERNTIDKIQYTTAIE